MKEFTYEIHRFEWRNIEISVRYCPDSFCGYAHLQIESVCRSPLPITETGYRSHFTDREVILEFGGPVGFAFAMLEEYAGKKLWKQSEAERKQLSLF